MKTLKTILLVLLVVCATQMVEAQNQKIAILNIDTKSMDIDPESMGNLVRLEVEKTGLFQVLDKYDLSYLMEKEKFNVDNCYGKICTIEAGKVLEADKMLTGSIEKFNDKIILILRLIDVHSEDIEKTNIMEYLDLPELQKMVQVSVNNIFDIPNNENEVELLSSYDDPINTAKKQLVLNGPRMGISVITGENATILQAPKDEGGFDGMPFTALIGYQFEKSYLTSGSFQALFEFVGFVGGLEQSRFIPSFTIMNGFRSNNSGWEIAFGPVLEITPKATLYHYQDKWQLEEDIISFLPEPGDIQSLESITRLDSRGELKLTTSWVWAFGKTFKSGYLNIPVNVYVAKKSGGWIYGASFGFNISKM